MLELCRKLLATWVHNDIRAASIFPSELVVLRLQPYDSNQMSFELNTRNGRAT